MPGYDTNFSQNYFLGGKKEAPYIQDSQSVIFNQVTCS